ncbi:hypothetical protein YB2330_000687 [Saitoella coloradoensis]
MNAVIPGQHLKEFSRILVCLSKLGDEVTIEPKGGKLILSSLNSSKSAFGMVVLHATKFFDRYDLNDLGDEGGMTCKVNLRLLLSIFRSRNIEARDNKDMSVEKCELRMVNSSSTGESRLVVRLICKHSVLKTYKLTYESANPMHAVMDKSMCNAHWRISSKMLREYSEHFANKAEELTFAVDEGGRIVLTSFTEGLVSEGETLRQPIQTTLSLDPSEFDDFSVPASTQFTLTLREFKAIIGVADSFNPPLPLSAYYSTSGGRPVNFSFEKPEQGIVGEFIVSTIAEGSNTQNGSSIGRGSGWTSVNASVPIRRLETRRSAMDRDEAGAHARNHDPSLDLGGDSNMVGYNQDSMLDETPSHEDQLGWDATDTRSDRGMSPARSTMPPPSDLPLRNITRDNRNPLFLPADQDDEDEATRKLADDMDEDEVGPTQGATQKVRGLFD